MAKIVISPNILAHFYYKIYQRLAWEERRDGF